MQPTLSVIIVTFNAETQIERAIQTVLAQTFKNLELIIIDGASTDNTVSKIQLFNQSKIRWTSEPDTGIYDAMNKGVAMASGEWVYFLGSDDVLLDESVFHSVFSTFDTTGIQIIYGNVISKSFKGKYDGRFTYKKLLSKNLPHQAAFYRRSLFQSIGQFNTKFKLHADWDFNLRCFENNVTSHYTETVVAEFGAGGASRNHDICFLQESLLYRSIQYFNNSGQSQKVSMREYDQYWRLIRNARIRSADKLILYSGGNPIPDFLLRIVKIQKKIPYNFLKKGLISKSVMALCFVWYKRVSD